MGTLATLNLLGNIVTGSLATVIAGEVLDALASGFPGPYRPVQWASPDFIPALTMTAVDPTTNEPTVYVFDTANEIEHEQNEVITENPVQTGAAINDHAYLEPPEIIADVVISDSMQSFTVGQWSDGPSRSVSAFQTLQALQVNRVLVSIATRLQQYDNLLIKALRAREIPETRYSLRCLIVFKQLITANVELVNANLSFPSVNDSTRPQSTANTILGLQGVQNVPTNVQSQYYVPNSTLNLATIPTPDGAGLWSSYPVSALPQVI